RRLPALSTAFTTIGLGAFTGSVRWVVQTARLLVPRLTLSRLLLPLAGLLVRSLALSWLLALAGLSLLGIGFLVRLTLTGLLSLSGLFGLFVVAAPLAGLLLPGRLGEFAVQLVRQFIQLFLGTLEGVGLPTEYPLGRFLDTLAELLGPFGRLP